MSRLCTSSCGTWNYDYFDNGNYSQICKEIITKGTFDLVLTQIYDVSFLIRPERAPARVELRITTILTMVTISRSARESLRKVPLTLFLLRFKMYRF